MSSVSNRSRFSVKSQQVMAEQDGVIAEQDGRIREMARKIAEMKRMLVEVGLAPAVSAVSTALATVTDPVCGMELDVQVRVQYARHARYYQYVQSRAVEAAKVVRVMEVAVLSRALLRVKVRAPVVANIAGVVEVEVAKVAKVVEVAKVGITKQPRVSTQDAPIACRALTKVVLVVCVDFVAPLVPVVQKVSSVRFRFKYKFKYKLKIRFKCKKK